jgi:hypothetical protein
MHGSRKYIIGGLGYVEVIVRMHRHLATQLIPRLEIYNFGDDFRLSRALMACNK